MRLAHLLAVLPHAATGLRVCHRATSPSRTAQRAPSLLAIADLPPPTVVATVGTYEAQEVAAVMGSHGVTVFPSDGILDSVPPSQLLSAQVRLHVEK